MNLRCATTTVLTIFLLGAALCVEAATKTWTGSAGSSWNNPNNWLNNLAPGNGDDLVFPVNAVRFATTNNFNSLRAFNSITFQGSNYVVGGSTLIVTNGISAQYLRGTNTIHCDIELRANQTFACPVASYRVLNLNGDVALGTHTLTVDCAYTSEINMSGVISSTGTIFAGGVTKTGRGVLRYIGVVANSYAGVTRVNEGRLELNRIRICVPGDLVVGDGNGVNDEDVVSALADNVIANTSDVTIHSSGALSLGHFSVISDAIGSLTMTGGKIYTGDGILTLNGNVTATVEPGKSAQIIGNLALGSVTRTFAVQGSMTIDAVVSGTGGITKSGSGQLWLAEPNTYSGLTTVQAGILKLNGGDLGATSAGTVVNSGARLLLYAAHVGAEPLTLNGNGDLAGGALDVDYGDSSWAGNITLASDSRITVASPRSLNLSGAINGAFHLTKAGPGTLILSGSANNSYTGNTLVDDGGLELAKTGGALALAGGQLVVGDGKWVRYAAANQIPTLVDIIVNAGGLLDLNNFVDTVGSIALYGGDIETGSGTLNIRADLTATSATGVSGPRGAHILGNIDIGSTPRVFTVNNGPASPDLEISATVSGATSITKTGTGWMELSGPNTFSGSLTASEGVLELQGNLAAGSSAGGVLAHADAQLWLRNAQVGDESLALGTAVVLNSIGENSWTGPVTLTRDNVVNVFSDTLTVLGSIGGPGGLTKTGSGTLIYSGSSANTYAGVTTLEAGTLVLAKSVENGALIKSLIVGGGLVRTEGVEQLPNTVAVTVNQSGRWEVNAGENSFGSLAGSGDVVVNVAPPDGIGPGFDNQSTLFSGVLSGPGAFTKNGSGTMTLNRNNTYTGPTAVNGGTLLVDGVQPQSHVTVGPAGTLGGSGRVGHVTNRLGGVVSPGSSAGRLSCNNATFSQSISDFMVELNGPTPDTGHDQLNALGEVSLGFSRLIVSLGDGFVPAEGQVFTIIANDETEPVKGTFHLRGEGAVLKAGASKFRLSYVGGDGNDVTLTHIRPPEAIAAMVSGGNGNHILGPNECNHLYLVITNQSGTPLTGVSAVFSAEGLLVAQSGSRYPDIPVSETGTNVTPFQISSPPSLACGTTINLQLVITSSAGTFASTLALVTDCVDGGGMCEPCPVSISGEIALTDPVQSAFVVPTELEERSTCVSPKVCPESRAVAGMHYDQYLFANTSSDAVCVEVTVTSACGSGKPLILTAYLGSFDPTDACANYLADMGVPLDNAATDGYSFVVPPVAEFVVVISEFPAGRGCDSYMLHVTGVSCPPPTLRITQVPPDKVTLDWPTSAGGYLLEWTPDLAPANWSGVPNEPIVVGGNFKVTEVVANASQFYRLRKP